MAEDISTGYKSRMNVLRCASKEQLAYEAAVSGAERIRQALHRRGSA